MTPLEPGRIVRVAGRKQPLLRQEGMLYELDGSTTSAIGPEVLVEGRTLGQYELLERVERCYLCERTLAVQSNQLQRVQQLYWSSSLIRCACGLVQKDVRAGAELLQRIYGFGYSNFSTPNLERARVNARSRLSRLGVTNGRLLDVGCGCGDFVLAASDFGFDAHGVDPFLPEETRALLPQTYRVDILDVEARAQLGTFDVVTLWAVWEHLVNPVEMIRAAASLLRTGGRLVLNSPNGESLHARLQSNWYMATLLEHLHFLTPQACRELARLTGLQVVNLRRCGTPYPLGSRGSGAAGQGLNHESLSFLMGVPLPALGEVQSKQASMKNRLVRTLWT